MKNTERLHPTDHKTAASLFDWRPEVFEAFVVDVGERGHDQHEVVADLAILKRLALCIDQAVGPAKAVDFAFETLLDARGALAALRAAIGTRAATEHFNKFGEPAGLACSLASREEVEAAIESCWSYSEEFALVWRKSDAPLPNSFFDEPKRRLDISGAAFASLSLYASDIDLALVLIERSHTLRGAGELLAEALA